MENKKPKFVCDWTVLKLARKLRIYGFDTLQCVNEKSCLELLNEGRILLTRNTKLYKKFENVIVFKSNRADEQLEEILKIFGKYISLPRCPVCNGELEFVDKKVVEGLVPSYIFSTIEKFKVCKTCGKIYWKGSHMIEERKCGDENDS